MIDIKVKFDAGAFEQEALAGLTEGEGARTQAIRQYKREVLAADVPVGRRMQKNAQLGGRPPRRTATLRCSVRMPAGTTYLIQNSHRLPTAAPSLPRFASSSARARTTSHPTPSSAKALPTGCMIEPQKRSLVSM